MFGGSGKKIVLDETVMQKAKVAAGIVGCTVEEFVARVVEKEAERTIAQTSNPNPTAAEVDQIANQLKGLGYLE
jgi:hypothetical protein